MSRNMGAVILGFSAALALIIAVLSLREREHGYRQEEAAASITAGLDELSRARQERQAEQRAAI